MIPPLKKAYKHYEIYGSDWLAEVFKTHPHLFETDLPGPHSTTQAPTLNEDTTVNSNKRPGDQIESPPAKIANTSTGEASLPIGAAGAPQSSSMSSLPGTGKEMADIGGSPVDAMVYHIERPLSLFASRNNVYRKVHKFMTFGLAPNILSYQQEEPAQNNLGSFLTTYLAEIPWHIPALYLNPSEFALLNIGARCLEISIEVYYRGTTLQFATASSATNLATLNQINDIAVANALNKSGQGSNISYTSFNATQTMIPTGITRPKYDIVGTTYRGMVQDYYGTNNDNTNFVNYIPHHQVGRQTFLYNYWAQSAISTTIADRIQLGGWPELTDKITQLDGKTAVNTCVLKSSYKPKMGMLKPPLKNVGHGLPLPTAGVQIPELKIAVGGNLPANRECVITPGNTSSSGRPTLTSETATNLSNLPVASNTDFYTLYTPIEKSQYTRTGFWGQSDPHIQPSIHVGVQPVPALTTSATLTSSTEDGTWTDVRAYWEVVATMVTKEHDPTEYPYASVSNVPVGDVIMTLNDDSRPIVNRNPRDDGATWAGLYTNKFARVGGDI